MFRVSAGQERHAEEGVVSKSYPRVIMPSDFSRAEACLERKIWRAACILRGNLDASDYRQVVLSLVFLKYLSERFTSCQEDLRRQGIDAVEGLAHYAAQRVAYIPEPARWEALQDRAGSASLGRALDRAFAAIEAVNPKLKGVFPHSFSRPELDQERLDKVFALFSDISLTAHGRQHDLLGRVYEYCLAQFAEQDGKHAGEYYTPACVVRTLVEVLQPFHGIVYDPACGSGGMFVQSAQFVASHRGASDSIGLYGQDSNPNAWKMARINLAIHGLEGHLGENSVDIFAHDLHPGLQADFILANPPFNQSDWGAERLRDDPRWQFGVPPAGNANFAWLQHMVSHLAPGGKIGMVLSNGSLSSQAVADSDIRRRLIEADLLEGIVLMPKQMFYSTQIPVSLWFLNRAKSQKQRYLFIDASRLGYKATRKLRRFSEADIGRIAAVFRAFQAGASPAEDGFCGTAGLAQLAAHHWILSPSLYMGQERRDGVAADCADAGHQREAARLAQELRQLLVEARKKDRELLLTLAEFAAESGL